MRSSARTIALIAITGALAAVSVVSDAQARRYHDGCGGPGQCRERHLSWYGSPGCGGPGQCYGRRYHRYRPDVYGCGGPGQCREGRTYIRRRPPVYYDEQPAYRYDYGYEEPVYRYRYDYGY
jgi:hypothetical protein